MMSVAPPRGPVLAGKCIDRPQRPDRAGARPILEPASTRLAPAASGQL